MLLKEDNSRFWDKSVSDYLKKQVEVDAHDACGGGENVARDELSTELEVLGSLLLQKGVLEDKFDQRTRWSLATFKPGTFSACFLESTVTLVYIHPFEAEIRGRTICP